MNLQSPFNRDFFFFSVDWIRNRHCLHKTINVNLIELVNDVCYDILREISDNVTESVIMSLCTHHDEGQ